MNLWCVNHSQAYGLLVFIVCLFLCSGCVWSVWRKYRCHCFSSDNVCVCVCAGRGGWGNGGFVSFHVQQVSGSNEFLYLFFFSRSPRPPTHAGALTWNLSRSLGLTLTLLALPLILLLYYRRSRQMLSLPFLVCLNALFFFLGFFCSFFFLNCSAVFTCKMSRSQLLSSWSVLFDFSFSAQSMCECQA